MRKGSKSTKEEYEEVVKEGRKRIAYIQNQKKEEDNTMVCTYELSVQTSCIRHRILDLRYTLVLRLLIHRTTV